MVMMQYGFRQLLGVRDRHPDGSVARRTARSLRWQADIDGASGGE
ncbi:hypothetical protein ACIHCV_38745 [Streptomyces sp. NPDC051956]